MDDREARHIAWWTILATAAVTVGATLLAIGFTFSITGETLENLTDGQRNYLRNLFVQYLVSGAFMIFGGLYMAWMQIFRRKNKVKEQKTS